MMYPITQKEYTNAVTDMPNNTTAATNMGVVFLRNASRLPTELSPCFSRILLSTCMNDDHATTVIAAMKLEEDIRSAAAIEDNGARSIPYGH